MSDIILLLPLDPTVGSRCAELELEPSQVTNAVLGKLEINEVSVDLTNEVPHLFHLFLSMHEDSTSSLYLLFGNEQWFSCDRDLPSRSCNDLIMDCFQRLLFVSA